MAQKNETNGCHSQTTRLADKTPGTKENLVMKPLKLPLTLASLLACAFTAASAATVLGMAGAVALPGALLDRSTCAAIYELFV